MKRQGWLVAMVAVLFACSGVQAQSIDGGAYFSPITDNVQPLLYGNLFSPSHLKGKTGSKQTATTRRSKSRDIAEARLALQFDPAVSAQARQGYVTAVTRAQGTRAGQILDAYYRSHSVHALMQKAMSPYRLKVDDVGDVLTAYVVVMWMTANDAPLPSEAQVRGLRRQMREMLIDHGRLPARATERQRVAESLMYQTVTMIRLRETAQAQRNHAYLTQLSDAAQDSLSRQRFDLRALRLSADGLVLR